jgi:hypothetical protein
MDGHVCVRDCGCRFTGAGSFQGTTRPTCTCGYTAIDEADLDEHITAVHEDGHRPRGS